MNKRTSPEATELTRLPQGARAAGGITNEACAAGGITNEACAAGGITNEARAAGGITNEACAAGGITNEARAAGAIATESRAAGAIATESRAAGAITNGADAAAEVAIEFNNVCFSYERDEVLHDISFSVNVGEFLAIAGPNGGGKSTMLKLMLGLLDPKCGRILVQGQSPARMSRSIGYVPQHIHFDPAFPVNAMDVVLMGRADRHLAGPYRSEDRNAALKALDQVRMTGFYNRSFSELSGGERQRVLIAQALASEPNMLFLDEPTSNIDASMEKDIFELLIRLNQQMTIVLVSHNLQHAAAHSSHILCVNQSATMLCSGEITALELHSAIFGELK